LEEFRNLVAEGRHGGQKLDGRCKAVDIVDRKRFEARGVAIRRGVR